MSGQRSAQTANRTRRTRVKRNPSDEPSGAYAAAHALDHEEIARLAYAAWEARGYRHGSPDDDWYWAEEQLRKKQAVEQ